MGTPSAMVPRMAHAARPLVSEAEFLSLPESTDKVELLDGEVIVAPRPSYWHQEVLGRLVVALREWAAAQPTPVTVGHAPLDVRFAPRRILQPDAFVILGSIDRDHVGPVDRIPDVCVEVLSTNRVHDRVTKRFVYGQAGVKELWTVETAGFVERWIGDGLATAVRVDDTLSTPVLPGLSLAVPSLFA